MKGYDCRTKLLHDVYSRTAFDSSMVNNVRPLFCFECKLYDQTL